MPSLSWYYRRLRTMSAGEMMFRASRLVQTRVDKLSSAPTSRRPIDWDAVPDLSISPPDFSSESLLRKADHIVDGTIAVFAIDDYPLGDTPEWNRDPKTGTSAPLTFGKTIDYRDESIVGDIKYLWEPSRHLMLPVLAQAYRLTRDERYLNRFQTLLDSWITQCPYGQGVHWCSSLESGIRLINWSLAWRILGCREGLVEAGVSDAFIERWMQSVYQHMHFIDGFYSGYSSANNHLIGEAAGVYVAAVTWPAWPEASRFRGRARTILIREAAAQQHDDGVNAEQAIAYQQFVADFLLFAGLMVRGTDADFPGTYWDNLRHMISFIDALMDVSGNVPMIGDADDGFVTDLGSEPDFCNFQSLLNTGAILFQKPGYQNAQANPDSKTAWLFPAVTELPTAQRHAERPTPRLDFPSGGYYILGSDFGQPSEIRIVADAGPLGFRSIAAHGHADALSFGLSVAGQPIFVDPGTFAYHTQQKWRDYFRGTSAHNTVRVDGVDQSVIGGNFMWSRHAQTKAIEWRAQNQGQQLIAEHDGYRRLDDPVTHRRSFSFDADQRELIIEDDFECNATHELEWFFHVAENVRISLDGASVGLQVDQQVVQMELDSRLTADTFQGDDDLPLGWISYRFDVKQPTQTLRAHGCIDGAASFKTRIAVQ